MDIDYPRLDLPKFRKLILDHTNLGEEAKIPKKFLIVTHRKLNGGCTTHIGNLINMVQSSVL